MPNVEVIAHEGKLKASSRRALTRALADTGLDAPWTMVHKAKKATKAVRAAVDRGADVVIVAGGDGTVRAASQALVGTATALAVLPSGTANLFATAFSLPTQPAAVVEVVTGGHRRLIDSAVCNDMTFNVMAGAGFDAGLIADADAHKGRLGMLAYVRSGIRHARSRRPFAAVVTVDGALFFQGNLTCVLVGNIGTLKAGLTALPAADPTDGRLDVAVVTATGLREWLSVLVSTVRRRQTESGHAHLGQGVEISVDLDEPHRFELDGGAKGRTSHLAFGIRPSSLTICVPAPPP
ncbi:MAG: YegS/Rv2252/BmrU family lipid kinase [Ilumatobacteraceae bacterium]